MKRVGLVLAALVLLTLITAGSAFALGQPDVNLGFTSFLDGAPPAGPGWYVSEYLQYYSADQLNDADGDKALDTDIDVWVLMNQLIYQSDQELLFGGKWGLNVMLPVVSVDTDSALPESGGGLGDLLVGPFIQWDPIMGEKGPIMVNRIELQTIWPTGQYDNDKLLNAGSNHFSFNPYWAATVFLGPKATVSWRLHYLWNAKNDDFSFGGSMPSEVDLEPGQALHANFAAAYEVLPKQLRLGINGYWFDQITDTEVDGTKDESLEEKVLAVGPGAIWSLSKDTYLFFNAYFETEAESRPEGSRYNLRVVHHF
jgi:anthranilate 1,2-dioxygenase (deaminating, decarboxylating) large subunit